MPTVHGVVEPTATRLRQSWMAIDPASGQVVGHASVRLDAQGASGRIGRVLVAPEARGKGVGAAMPARVLAAAFGELGLERVELGVWTDNSSAIRLYEGLGFKMSLPRSAWGAAAASG